MRKFYFPFFVFATLLLQGCFELIEQIQLNDNGSGNIQLTLNMSQSKTKLNSILKLKTVNGHPVPSKDEIISKLKELENTLKNTAGITNTKVSMDFNNYICSISYNFSGITQLNQSIKNIELQEKASGSFLTENFSYDIKRKIFQRKNNIQFKDIYAKMSNADKEIFSAASYTSIYKFESPVITSTNKDAKIASNKKAVMLRETAMDIITEKKSIENKINITNQ